MYPIPETNAKVALYGLSSFKMIDYSLNGNQLLKVAEEHKSAYKNARPFPHIILDNIFPGSVLDTILEEFPSSDGIDWTRFNNPYQLKLATRSEEQFGSSTRTFLHLLNSQVFLDFLATLTGIGNDSRSKL